MAAHFVPLNVSQYIQPGRGSLHRSFLDYDFFRNSSILNSIASTIAVIGLNAMLLQLIFLLGGLTTHSAALSAMLQGSLFSDCVTNLFSRKAKSEHMACKTILRLRLKAVLLVSFAFGADSVLTFIQTSRNNIVSSKDLSLVRLGLDLYEGESKFANPEQDRVPLINASREVSHRYISICITHGGAPSAAFLESGPDFLGIMVDYLFDRKMNIKLITSDMVHTLGIEITLHLTSNEEGTAAFNITKLHHDPSQVALWLMRRVADLYTCEEITEALDLPAMYSSMSCSFNKSSEVAKMSFSLFLGALSLSPEPYSEDDFLTLRASSISNWTSYPSPSGRRALLQFARYDRSRVDGGVLWILAALLVLFALRAGFYSLDYELAKDLAVAEQLEMGSIPIHASSHSILP